MTEALRMLEYRITKYDPDHRDATGAYTRASWTAFANVGRAFNGVVLTPAAYEVIEDAYVETAVSFLRESAVGALNVAGSENARAASLPFVDGSSLGVDEVAPVVRRLLRGQFWCRLEGEGAFVHVGWDYYMYVGVPRRCPVATAAARRWGLFVEPFLSPYVAGRRPG